MTEVDKYLAVKEKEYNIHKNTYKVIPWLESPLAIVNAYEIMSKFRHRIEAAAFGGDDYCTDCCIKRTANDLELELPKKLFAMYCHAAEVVAMDTPYVHINNPDGLKQELEMLKQFGFKAKFAIHPTQVDIIEKAFVPDPKDVDYSRRLAEAFENAIKEGKAAIIFENKMVDIAAYKRAANMLKRAGVRKYLPGE